MTWRGQLGAVQPTFKSGVVDRVGEAVLRMATIQ